MLSKIHDAMRKEQKMNIEFSASMMCANYANLEKEVKSLDAAGIDSYHIDIMDGNFVDNFGMGFQDMEYIRSATKKDLEIHLMMQSPERYLDILKQVNANVAYIHPESTYATEYVIEKMRNLGVVPGIAVNPGTSIYSIMELLNIVDKVLVLCVNPGHAGRQFEPYVTKKIEELLRIKDEYQYEVYLDGACTFDRIQTYSKKGVKGFVLGTSVLFGHQEGYQEILSNLRQ